MNKLLISCALVLGVSVGISFAADDYWTLNASGGWKITDGEWVFNVSVDEEKKELTLTGVSAGKDTQTILDLAKPVRTDDGTEYAIIGMTGNTMLAWNNVLEALKLPDGFRKFGKIFCNSTALTNVMVFLPATVNEIGEKTFMGCTSLVGDLVLNADGRPFIFSSAGHAFQDTKITGADLGSGVTNIPSGTFSGCAAMTNVVLRGKVEIIGNSAFSGCSVLTNINMSKTVKRIESRAFYKCGLNGDFVFDNNIESVGEKAFESCYKVTSLVFNGDVGNIGYEAVIHNTAVTNLVFGGSVGSIADRSFITCKTKTLYFNGMPSSIGTNAFRDTIANARMYVSRYNAEWKAFLRDPSMVTPWRELTDAQRKAYTDLYPGEETPKGLFVVSAKSSFGFGNKGNLWVMAWSPPNAVRPRTMIFLQ